MKYIYAPLCLVCLFSLTGCSTPTPGKSLEELQKSSNSRIDQGNTQAKSLVDKAIDLGTDQLQGASKEIGIAAGSKAKELIKNEMDTATDTVKGAANEALGNIGDSVNKQTAIINEKINTVQQGVDTAKETGKKTIEQVKTVVVGGYTVYSSPAVDAALKAGKKVYLFFSATWCPSCKALDTDIIANKATIPNDTVIFKVDYDLYIPLKTLYGVTAQHTIVSLNKDASKKSLKQGIRDLAGIFSF